MTGKMLLVFWAMLPFAMCLVQEDHKRAGFPIRNLYGDGGQSLAGGLFITSSNMQSYIRLMQDFNSIQQTQNITELETLYREGRLLSGQEISQNQMTLESFSLTATELNRDEPTLAVYNQAFKKLGENNGEENGKYLDAPSELFANSIVSDHLREGRIDEAKEAITVFIIWFNFMHEVNLVNLHCSRDQNATLSMSALDKAATLWFGESAVTSSLLEFTKATGYQYEEQLQTTSAHSQISENLVLLKELLLNDDSCSHKSNVKAIHDLVNGIESWATVPIVQKSIHLVLSDENEQLAMMYALALLPNAEACDPNLAKDILTKDENKMEWAKKIQNSLSCFRLDCNSVGNYAVNTTFPRCIESPAVQFAGYFFSTQEAENLSRLDRDLQRLSILLDASAYDSALDLYKNKYHASISLQELALNSIVPSTPGSTFDLFRFFHAEKGAERFLDQEVQEVLRGSGVFTDLTSEERRDIVIGLLSYEASYLSILSALEVAKTSCQSGTNPSNYLDIGAAIYTGTLEGQNDGGSMNGRMLYGVAKDLCSAFSVCEEENSRINNMVIEAFRTGNQYLTQRDCDSFESLVDDIIEPAINAILVQGFLAFGVQAVTESDIYSEDSSRGTLHSFARSIIPLVYEANNQSIIAIEDNMVLPAALDLTIYTYMDAVDSLQVTLSDIPVPCESVGRLQALNLSLCHPIQPQHPTNKISFGRYLFNDKILADATAGISLDINEMVNSPSMDDLLQIYENGRKGSAKLPFFGKSIGSLESFGTIATSYMTEDPIFNFYKFAFYEKEDLEANDPFSFTFGDDMIRMLARNNSKNEVVAEAIVALNVRLMILHTLQEGVRLCTEQQDPSKNVDAAVALWIGKDQEEGTFREGWLMYDMIQQSADAYGLSAGEAVVNTQLMSVLNSIQATSSKCQKQSDAHLLLRQQIRDVERLLSIPLLQQLLLTISAEEQQRVAIYATSIFPLFTSCYHDTPPELVEILQSKTVDVKMNQILLDLMPSFLECLDIPCDNFEVKDDSSTTLKTIVGVACASTGNQVSVDPIPEEAFGLKSYESEAKLARDAQQIAILMDTGAQKAALDIYYYGRNSESSYQRIQEGNAATLVGNAFRQYHGSDSFIEEFVTNAISGVGVYQNTTVPIQSSGTSASLQLMVGFYGIMGMLERSHASCLDGDNARTTQLWNGAAGLYNGSIDARSLRSMTIENCAIFGTCIGSDNSVLSTEIDIALQKGLSAVTEMICDEIDQIVKDTIYPLLLGSILQSLARSSVYSEEEEDKESVQLSAYVIAQTVLPSVNQYSAAAASRVASIFDTPLSNPNSIEEIEDVLDAIQGVLSILKIDCSLLGSLIESPSLSFCHNFQSIVLLPLYSMFDADVRDILQALRAGQIDSARSIYLDGRNAINSAETKSLQDLSIKEHEEKMKEPLFEIYRIVNDGQPSYADKFVQEILTELNNTSKDMVIAAEAIVISSVWMEVFHLLYQAIALCHNESSYQIIHDVLQKAASLYIGNADIVNRTDKGHLLYAYAQEMEDLFDKTMEPEFPVNDRMLSLFASAKEVIYLDNACTSTSNTEFRLSQILNEVMQQMTIPLIQSLIHAIKSNDAERVHMYALSVLPLISTCDQKKYDELYRDLIESPLQALGSEALINSIYASLPCLQLSCTQIGFYPSKEDRPSVCGRDEQVVKSQYEAADVLSIQDVSKIDQDLRDIELLLQADSFDAASHVYRYGRQTTTSMSILASKIHNSLNISVVDAFSTYYQESNYIDDLLLSPLSQGKFNGTELSISERQTYTIGFSQMVLLPQAIIHYMSLAKDFCSIESEYAMASWDRAAAIFLGSHSITGSSRLSPYDLAQDQCAKFSTCRDDEKAQTNHLIVELFVAGQAATHAKSCAIVSEAAREIEKVMIIPIIQTTISSSRSFLTLDQAFVASQSLAPYIQYDIAWSLEEKISSAKTSFDSTLAPILVDMLSETYEDLNIDCELIGQIGSLNPCSSENFSIKQNSKLSAGSIVAIVFSIVAFLLLLFLIWRRMKSKTLSHASSQYIISSILGVMKESNNSATSQDESDSEVRRISQSFRKTKAPKSYKAKRALDRIMRYGDDDIALSPPKQSSSKKDEWGGVLSEVDEILL